MTAPGAPIVGLLAYLVLLATQRIAELVVSARHARALFARGGIEAGAGHFPLFVILHAAWPLMLMWEVLIAGARPPAWWPVALVLTLCAAALRQASIHALGEHWTARVVVLPDHPRVRRGIHRWLRHPSYVGVTLELLAAPLMFGAWRTALFATFGNALALAIRIPVEERALDRARPR